MALRIPPAIQWKIERWLEHQCWSSKDWRIQPVEGSGQSLAQIWRLVPKANEVVDSTTIEQHQGTGDIQHAESKPANDAYESSRRLGFALRNWGRGARDRQSIQQILFFQKAAHLGLLETMHRDVSIALLDDFLDLSIVPNVMAWSDQTWCVEYASSIWTLETWRPGIPLDRDSIVSDALLHQAFDVLERLHATGRKLGVHRMIAPGLVERSQRLTEWKSIDLGDWQRHVREQSESISAILELDLCLDILRRTLDRHLRQSTSIRSGLQRMLDSPVDCHWIVRDLWRENILVDADRISGIIDFGAARIDWPILEIVRWFSSWLKPDDPRLSRWLEESQSLTLDDYRFLDQTSTLLSLLQWFHWLLIDNITFEGREHRVRSRILELDQRLSQFAD